MKILNNQIRTIFLIVSSGALAAWCFTGCVSVAGTTQKVNAQTVRIQNELVRLRDENTILESKIASLRSRGDTAEARTVEIEQGKILKRIADLEERVDYLSSPR